MTETNQTPEPEETLLTRVLNAAPQVVDFFVQACEAVGAELTHAAAPETRKQIREALISGEHLLEVLKVIPDLPEDQYEQVIDELIDHVIQGQAQ